MLRKITLMTMVLALVAGAFTLSVYAIGPNFSPQIYADGEAWGTKGVATLPAPNKHNVQSFDKLFVITNGAAGQLPVAEAAPGNRYYNGGRWFTHTVTWTQGGMDYYEDDGLPVLKSYDQIMDENVAGHLIIVEGSPMGGPRPYFECPLLPVK